MDYHAPHIRPVMFVAFHVAGPDCKLELYAMRNF